MDDTLTVDKLLAVMRSFPKVPPQVKIYATVHWPVEFSHMETRRFEAHSIIKWLARWLPITPYVECYYPVYKDKPAMFDQRTGHVYCSLRQERAMLQELNR